MGRNPFLINKISSDILVIGGGEIRYFYLKAPETGLKIPKTESGRSYLENTGKKGGYFGILVSRRYSFGNMQPGCRGVDDGIHPKPGCGIVWGGLTGVSVGNCFQQFFFFRGINLAPFGFHGSYLYLQ
jgi:hypothetical protein